MTANVFLLTLVIAAAASSVQASFNIGRDFLIPKDLYDNAERKVVFTLYTRTTADSPTTLYSTDEVATLKKTALSTSRPTKLVIHGFMSHMAPGTAGFSMKDALLKVEDCNLVLVDWSALDNLGHMTFPDKVVPAAGEQVANFLNTLVAAGVKVDSIHLFAHSLGAHIAGYAGMKVLGPAKAGKITALDPVGQGFEKEEDTSKRLDPSDAGFVVAIHTDAGNIGIERTVGHADFYPDGGQQPHNGCSTDLTGVCSHCLVYEIFLNAITNPNSMVGTKCSSWSEYQSGSCAGAETAVIGINTDSSARGTFYLSTTIQPTQMQWLLGRDVGGFAMDLFADLIFKTRDVMAIIHC